MEAHGLLAGVGFCPEVDRGTAHGGVVDQS